MAALTVKEELVENVIQQTVEMPRVEIRQEIEQRRNVQTQEVIKEVVTPTA